MCTNIFSVNGLTMNFIALIRESFGQLCLRELRQLEKLQLKRASQRNHLRFNHCCRDEGIIPTSLNMKNPIRANNSEPMIKRLWRASQRVEDKFLFFSLITKEPRRQTHWVVYNLDSSCLPPATLVQVYPFYTYRQAASIVREVVTKAYAHQNN